jgi:hypothetical protein
MTVTPCAFPLYFIAAMFILMIVSFIIRSAIKSLLNVKFTRPVIGRAALRWGLAFGLIFFIWHTASNMKFAPCDKTKQTACNCGQKKTK